MDSVKKAWIKRCMMHMEGNKLHAEGSKLYAEGYKLCTEGNLLFINAIIEKYGSKQEILWKDNDVEIVGKEYLRFPTEFEIDVFKASGELEGVRMKNKEREDREYLNNALSNRHVTPIEVGIGIILIIIIIVIVLSVLN